MPAIQINIATFPSSDAFASNPDMLKAPVDMIKSADGHKASFYGIQVEDNKKGYFVSVWESHDHHRKLVESPNYASIIEKLKPTISGQFERNFINISHDPLPALSSPAVEIVTFTLKSGSSAEQLTPLMEELGKGLDTATGAHPPCAWGQSVEDKNKVLLIVGWDTVEAHWEAVKEGTGLHATIVKIKDVADLSIGHSHVKKHEG
ncbi:hypothetical protein R3P38DRAFT_2869335 [Favolaschia claudopus]|uniref:ABM domain-containing protein n=1 Tax=Favolaschia claudopus TaxID=2862362 RepID=A0AAW0D6M1_9AGAR